MSPSKVKDGLTHRFANVPSRYGNSFKFTILLYYTGSVGWYIYSNEIRVWRLLLLQLINKFFYMKFIYLYIIYMVCLPLLNWKLSCCCLWTPVLAPQHQHLFLLNHTSLNIRNWSTSLVTDVCCSSSYVKDQAWLTESLNEEWHQRADDVE